MKSAPFTEKMRGKDRLELHYFSVDVLEQYIRDPRYSIYTTDDFRWSLSVNDDFYMNEEMAEEDKIVIEHFGFAFEEGNTERRVLVVALCYLAELSPKHQRIWWERREEGKYLPHPMFVERYLKGSYEADGVSVIDAILEEINEINLLSMQISNKKVFGKDYGSAHSRGARPQELKNLSFLIRPTREAFLTFIVLLNNTIVENIDKKFFSSVRRIVGEAEYNEMKTLQLLDKWLKTNIPYVLDSNVEEILAGFREISAARNKIHKLAPDFYDESIYKDQKDILKSAFETLDLLRVVMSVHPSVSEYQPSEVLDRTRICWH